jgi:1,2-diacylglycerol 3-alpha-glucosyltransferase
MPANAHLRPESGDRVAVIFDNYGPYHHARLDAAANLMDVCGIELSGSSNEYAWKRSERESSWDHHTLFPGQSCRTVPRRQLARRVTAILDRLNPSVVAVSGWNIAGSNPAVAWCESRGVPTVLMSETTAHDFVRRPLVEALKSRLVRIHSAALVGGSSHADYLRQLGMPGDRIFLGYDAIDNRHFAIGAAAARQDAERLRRQYALPERYFLASARFVEKKNLLMLLEAYASYRFRQNAAGTEPWSLVLLGDGPLAPAIRERVHSLELGGSVLLPGFQQYPELPIFYGLAGAFVHASTTEQWGLVVNEAMAAGLPILVSQTCGCAGELVHPGENGFVFDPNSSGQLTDLMESVASSSCDRAAMGAVSTRIVGDFGPERFGDGLMSAVKRAKETGPPTPGILTKMLINGLTYLQ